VITDQDDLLPPLVALTKLQQVSIRGNPIARLPDTRLKIIAALPQIRIIDG